MTEGQLSARLKVDEEKIAEALEMLKQATNSASASDLQMLHFSGVLPTGALHFLLACRAASVANSQASNIKRLLGE